MPPWLDSPASGGIMLSGCFCSFTPILYVRSLNWVIKGSSSLGWWLVDSVWSSTGVPLLSWSRSPVCKSRLICVVAHFRHLENCDLSLALLLHHIWLPPVLCWNHQHWLRCLQDGQSPVVSLSLLVCSRSINQNHLTERLCLGISWSLPTTSFTGRLWWNNLALS